MQSGRCFSRREQSRYRRFSGIGGDFHSARHVVAGGPDFHGSLDNVHIRQLQKLVIHAGQLSLYVFSRCIRDIEERAAMLSPAALAYFGVDGARHHITSRKLHPLGIVTLHKVLTGTIAENATFAPDRFRYQNSLHAGRPHHAGGMKLHEFRVHQISTGIVGERHAVAGIFPGIRSNPPGFANPAGCQHDRFRPEHHKPARLAPVSKGAGDAVAIFQQARDRALHVDGKAHRHATILQGADHL
jgi:hypothetical protein